MNIWPSIAEERAMALHRLLPLVPGGRGAHRGTDPGSTWKTHEVVLRTVLFGLTCAAAAAISFLAAAFAVHIDPLLGLGEIVAAEYLILRKRFFRTGVELALWFVGAINIVSELGRGTNEALLAAGLALALAGFRMRSAIIGVVSAVYLIVYVGTANKGPAALALTVALTLLAVNAMLYEWQRRSTEQLFQGFALVLPAAGYVVALLNFDNALGTVYAVLSMVILTVAIWRRDRILLIAGTLTTAIATIETLRHLDAAYEWKLLAAGAVTLAIALTLTRALRRRTRGFVARRVEDNRYDAAMQLAAAIRLGQPSEGTSSAVRVEPGGGPFGGGGASTSY